MPLLLVAVALVGIYRSAGLQQSSWQGASFGMFATYDNDSSRSVIVTVTEAGRRRRVRLPEDLRDDATRLRVVPTDAAARALAAAVLDASVDDATGARVEVWRLVLEGDARLSVRVEPIASGSARR